MAKPLLFLALILSLSVFIDAKVVIPENYQEPDASGNRILTTPVEKDPKILLPNEEQAWDSPTLRAPPPTQPDMFFAGNRRFHHLYIRRPYIFRFPHRFRHHHIEFTNGDSDFFPEKEAEFESDFQRFPIGSRHFGNGSPEDHRLPVGHTWFDEHGHHDHDHHQTFMIEKLNRRLVKDHEGRDDEKNHDERNGGFFKWINNVLHLN